jgi:hypothetical protein
VIYTNGGDVRSRRSTMLAGMASGTEVTVFTPPATWSRLTNEPSLLGQQWRMALPPTINGQRFYRLEAASP